MELKPHSSHSINIVTKKKFRIKSVLNLYGIFIFLGLIVSIFTVPLTINEELELTRNKMEITKIKKYLSFIFSSGIIYFFSVNVYGLRKIGRKLFLITMVLVLSFSIFMIFYLLSHPTKH
ncbi:hypothetical protein FS935_18370 [Metabacillus litoralis]|uniref:Uncharacterized protein n=1 Tax=Metabacillus litoralis TaxID=152268 RepID=A0A5C6VRJ5_9BACI|nr:hypothetical protein [Metabacillus litoralis]TXC86018.1 hypothetical protein FS935_18370 [Metabacillus litoralis]